MGTQERFSELLAYLDLGPVQLAKECNLKDGRITDIVRGKVKKVAIDVADAVTWKFPSVSKDWLLYGIGEMLVPEPVEVPQVPNYDARINELLAICSIQQESINQLHQDITSLVKAINSLVEDRTATGYMVADELPKKYK